jgi:hypothetical protein
MIACAQLGRPAVKRGHEHHLATSAWVCLERGPRRGGGDQGGGGTLKVSSSAGVQQWSVRLAAITGVRCTQ